MDVSIHRIIVPLLDKLTSLNKHVDQNSYTPLDYLLSTHVDPSSHIPLALNSNL